MQDNIYKEIYNRRPKIKQDLTQYKSSLMSSLPVSPDQATKQYQLSKQTGIPVGIVRAKENEIAQRTELATFEDEDFINNFPQVVAQLSNPNIAGAIKDDIDSLSKFEKIARSTKEKYQQSALMDETLDLRLKRMSFESGNQDNKLSPSEEALISEFERQQPKDYKLGFLESIIPETAGAARTIFGVAREAGPKALVGTGLGAGIGAITGAIMPTKAVPQMTAAGARLGLKISAPTASGYEMAKLETAGAYDELRNIVDESGKPLEKDIAAGAAVLTGAVNGAIELIPAKIGLDTIKKSFSREGTKQLVKSPIAREYLKNIGKGVVAEGGTEGVQEFFNIMFTEAAKAASKGDFKILGMKDENDIDGLLKFASESYSRVEESVIAGGAAGAGFSVVGGGVIAGKRVYDQRQQNQKEKQIISELNQVASQSKVLKRDADLFKEATKETLGQVDFYIPAEEVKTYFQDRPDAFQKFLEIPQVKEQYEEALDLGGNLIIPANEVYANAKINPDIAGLQEFAKLSPESLNELEAQDEFLTRAVPEIIAEEEEILRNRERNEIKLNIRKQISNLIPTKEQEDYIKLLENYYDTRAKRYGNETAKQILESYLGQLELNQKKFQKPSPFRQIEDLDLMIDKARKPIKQPKPSKPLLRTLKEMGGVKLGSNLAGELNAIGVNPKTAPALFKKNGGIGDIDNIPLSEFQGRFPNVQAIADETGSYVDRNYLLNLLSEEQFGKDITQVKTPEQEQIDNFLQGLEEAGIDLNASNEEIKKAIKEYQGRTFNQTQEIKLEQKGRYGSFYGKFNGADIRVSDHPAGKKAQEIEGGAYEGGKRSIGLENYQELKENGVKFYASDDFRDIVIPVKAKVDVDLENQIKIQERQIAELKALNSKEYQDLDKSQLNNELNELAQQRQKINKKPTYELTEQDKENLKQIKERENQIFESKEYKNQSEQRDKTFKELIDKELTQLTKEEKEQAKTKAEQQVKNLKKDSTQKANAKEQAILEKFKKIEPFVKSKILELEQTYFQTQDQTKTPAFKKWFGDSKVVDEKGEPLVVYHGTDKEFTKFDKKKTIGGQFWFTNKKDLIEKGEVGAAGKGRIVEAYLSIKNPARWDEYEKFTLDELISRGYDGIILEEKDQNTYVAFEPTQIKSVENRGTFDPESANIYYQSAPTFYSALEKQITDLPQAKGSPEQWAGIIKNLTQKGVKQEELDWTGIEEWIKEQKGSVTKEQILDYLKANKIEVEEVVKGDISEKVNLVINKTEDGYFKVIHPEKGVIYTASFEDQAQRYIDEYAPDSLTGIKSTKFEKYTLAGGENYRELLLTLPVKETVDNNKLIERYRNEFPNSRADDEMILRSDWALKNKGKDLSITSPYKSSHYDEPNILAHIRFNERTDKDGKRIMFVEELQSDWHQEGRKKGYKAKARDTSGWRAEMQPSGRWAIFDDNNQWMSNYSADSAEEAIKMASESRPDSRVPNAPFKTTWNELAFKRALLWAVENGFDKVAWTTGEMQAERYDLSKQISKIDITPYKTYRDVVIEHSSGSIPLTVDSSGKITNGKSNFIGKGLDDVIGKEFADKILKVESKTSLSGLDLKVGGEGMKGFYDKILPTAVNKLVKKFGGKVEQTEIDAGKVWSLDITPAMQETISKQGLPLFQNASSPKGQTQFIGQKPVITLFEKADRSTLLHELGHLFLQIEADVAKLPNMPADFKKDWATLENWLGVKDGVITREAHEKFARGFEAYLREGKAPSLELRSAFRRFKAWLVRVYQDVMNLNVRLNDNIRGYFDKLLATDEAIETQKNNPIFATDTNVLELLTAKEKEDYIKLSDNAKEKTKEQLLKKAFKQSDIKNKKFYKEELENVKKEIQDELEQDKTYRVLTYLKTGKINDEEQPKKLKLSREDVKNNYDGEFIKYLPKSIFGKDGVEVALLADEFGFKSGSEMLYSIANAPDYKARVEELADQEMTRRYGDILKDGTIEREALEMAENDARARKIVYELNAINRKVKTITESKEAYKQKAKEIIENKNLVEATDTNKFYVNALKAAREAGKYLGKKDYEKAVEWKKKQLLNHYLFRESKALRDEIKASKKRYDSYKKKPAKGKVRIDEDYRVRIVNLLQDFGLANKPIDYVQTNINELENWKKEKQSEGVLGLVEFPEIADFQNKFFNQLTVQEYRTLDNAIENLAHIGESERFIEVEGKRIELATLSEELSESIKSNLKEKPKIIGSKTKIEELKDKFDEANSTITKAKNIALKLDGEKPLGKFYNAFIKPVGNQELVRNEMIKEASDKLNEIFDKYLSKLSKKREYFQEVNAELSRQNLVAIALNWGNDINKKRIKDGFGWTDQQVVSLLSNLTKNEWSYVQEIWDYLDSFWDKSSSLHKKLLGFAPKKQRFTPFKIRTSDGEEMSLKGGYYPIAYTKESSLREGELDAYKQVAINYEKSYLKERTDKKVDKELTLTLTPLYTHISQVVNDLAMKEATWNSDKVLKSRKVENAITRTAGVNQYKELKGWLEDLFGVAQTPAGWLGASINHLRAGMTISTMGLKASSVIIQASGYAQSIVKIGYAPMLKGLFKFLGNGNLLNVNKSMNEALAKSKILKTREITYHRDIFETLRSMERKGKLPKNLVAYYFYPMAKMQMLVDIPTWYGAYYKGLKDFNGDDAKAVDYADLMVVQSQGSGLMQDLSSFERGSIGGQRKSELIKMFTAFYTYFNAKWNLAQESYRRTNFRKPSDVAKFASDMMLLYFIEALIGEAILGKVPDFDDEDEDTFAIYSTKLVASNFFSQFPISREVVSGLKGFDVSPAGFSGLASITKGGVMVSKELQEEEVDITKIIEGLNQGGGVIFHYPSGQVDVFIDAIQKAQEGEEVAPINYLLRDNKK